MTLTRNLQNFQQENGYVINDQNNGQYGRRNETIMQPLNMIQKSSNQIFVTTQMHIFL